MARLVNLSGEGLQVDAMVMVVLVLRVEHIGDELGAEGRRALEQADQLSPELTDHYEVDDHLNAAQQRQRVQVDGHVVRDEHQVWHERQLAERQHGRDGHVRHDEQQVDERHDDQHAGRLRLAIRRRSARDRRALPRRLHNTHADHEVRGDDHEKRHEVREARVPDHLIHRPHEVLALRQRRAAAQEWRIAPCEEQVGRPVECAERGHSDQHFPAEELLESPRFERHEYYEESVQWEERGTQHVERFERRL